MNENIRKYLMLSFCLFMGTNVLAQENSIGFNFNYGTLSSSDLHDFISDDSWVGWYLDYERYLKPQLSVGLSTGYQKFDEKRARNTYVIDNTAINAVTWRNFHTAPLFLNIKYYFTELGFRPYVGGGIGGAWNRQTLDYGSYRVLENALSLNTMAEVGTMIFVGYNLSVKVSARYNLAIYNPDEFEISNYGFLNIGLGLTYKF